MQVVVVTPPSPFVDLDLAKQHLRVDGSDDDSLISLYIAAAQSMIDGPGGWLGRAIGVQTLELRLDGFPPAIWGWSSGNTGLFFGSEPSSGPLYGSRLGSPSITLPYPPLIQVNSVTYEDANGVQQALPSSAFLASDEGLTASFGTVFPSGRWEPRSVRIQYDAGYALIPAAISAAMLLMVGDLYGNRTTVETGVRAAAVSVPMSATVEALLAPYRVIG
ncbi:head-tail connector protein [Sphingomonas sp. UYP23]